MATTVLRQFIPQDAVDHAVESFREAVNSQVAGGFRLENKAAIAALAWGAAKGLDSRWRGMHLQGINPSTGRGYGYLDDYTAALAASGHFNGVVLALARNLIELALKREEA